MTTLPLPPRFPRRVVYLGTPDVAVPPLVALYEAGFEIPLVVSGADKRRGRGRGVSPSPVKAAALELGLSVTDDLWLANTVDADIGVVVAYGRIIKLSILERLPMVNIHFSLLPRWRGAAPVERALLAGDSETGVCLMTVAQELDTGDIFACRSLDIELDHTLETLRSDLVKLGSDLLVTQLSHGLDSPQPQRGTPIYAHKISAEEYQLDLNRSAAELMRVISLGRAWTTIRGRRLKVLAARLVESPPGTAGPVGSVDQGVVITGQGGLELVEVQPEGKRAMDAASWFNGAQLSPSDRFGC